MNDCFWTSRGKCLLVITFMCLFALNLPAQLCQGSLGDPIVNKTFGAGSNPGAPLQAATTSYQYVSGDCPNDGFYTVRNNTNQCFGNSWHTLGADHTGDPNGYFMLVNASLQPSAFYLDTVRGLCPGTTFEFAAWIMNVLLPSACSPNPITPNLTFTIERTDGTILQTYNTGSIATSSNLSWKQYGFFFTTPIGVSDIVLRIFNNSQGGCGNDLALDDITFRPCGPQITPAILENGNASIDYCEGVAKTFTFNCTVSAGFNNPSFQWQQSVDGGIFVDLLGATTTSYVANFSANVAPGIYRYRLAAAESGNLSSIQCRVVSTVITLTINANPVTTVSSDSPVCQNTSLNLSATGGVLYQWSGPAGFTAAVNPAVISNVQVNQSGKYYVLVSSAANCKHLDSVIATVNPAPVATSSIDEVTICEGKSVQLAGSGGGSYLWSPSNGLSASSISNPEASPSDTTVYSLIVTNSFNCTDTATSIINVIKSPTVDAGTNKSIIKGNSVLLTATATGQNVTYTWTPSVYIDNISILQPTVNPPRDTVYVLTATSLDGCGIATDSVHVLVFKDIFVPTAFSPDGNGINDTWSIPALAAYPEYEISVFNRYGQLIFFRRNNNQPWDGTLKGVKVPSGVYVYMIKVKQGNMIKGTLTLIR